MSKPSRRRFRLRWGWLILLVLLLIGISFHFAARSEIPVLMYHFVSPVGQLKDNQLVISDETLDRQLRWLKKWGYRVYSLDEYADWRLKGMPSHEKGVVLTFDDGNQDFYDTIFPILQVHQVPAASFLVWDNLANGKMGSMSINQARELLTSSLVTLGVHTIHHKNMVRLSQSELEEETTEAKRLLENALPVTMKYFCYPSGYFDADALAQVKKAGFTLAFTTTFRQLGTRPETSYSIARIKIAEKDSQPISFWYKVSGYYSVFEKIRRKFISLFRRMHD